MSAGDDGTKDIQGDGEAVLRDAAARLRELLAELAHNLRPFPAFLNMASVQAVELESPLRAHGGPWLRGGASRGRNLRDGPVGDAGDPRNHGH